MDYFKGGGSSLQPRTKETKLPKPVAVSGPCFFDVAWLGTLIIDDSGQQSSLLQECMCSSALGLCACVCVDRSVLMRAIVCVCVCVRECVFRQPSLCHTVSQGKSDSSS
jgi:hypothetical protein